MRRTALAVALGTAVVAAMSRAPQGAAPLSGPVEILAAIGALPASLTRQLMEPIGFAQTSTGEYLVLDRRAHTVYRIDAFRASMRPLIDVGFEEGRFLEPGVLALSAFDTFAVSDAPRGLERVQFFSLNGQLLGGFYLPKPSPVRVVAGRLVLSGVGSMQFTGKTFLVNRPESGALFQELDTEGHVLRQIGSLRPTGHEADRDVHLAMNIGLPLADPAGGFIFVFETGVPMFRKYDASGALRFERHIEGVEIDDQIQHLPTTWPARASDDRDTLPVVDPLVRTAAIDSAGRLWVSLMTPFTYVYDAAGEKIRTVQFRGADVVSPASLAFAKNDHILVTPGCYEFRAEK